jgi:deoxyribonuclease V
VEELLDQIPAGRTATPEVLAEALGDALAAPALRGFLGGSSHGAASRVIASRRGGGVGAMTPSEFRSHRPLRALRAEQEALARNLIAEEPSRIGTIGGVDVAYKGREAFSAAVVMDCEGRDVVEEARARTEVRFPYIPTYFAYREIPPLRSVLSRLSTLPDVLLVEGHGTSHPVGLGLAAHLGLLLDLPTIGAAREALRGQRTILLRRPGYRRPIHISPGHRMTAEAAARIVGRCTRHLLPEPLRIAHILTRMKSGEGDVQ